MRNSWVAYRDDNDTEVIIGYDSAVGPAPDGWQVQHTDWVDLKVSHPLLGERIEAFVEDLPVDDPFSVEETALFCTVLEQALNIIDGEMYADDSFAPRADDPEAHGNEVVIRIDSNLLTACTDPLYVVATGLDYLSSTALERLRKMAYERKSLTILVSVPDTLRATDLDEAIRRRHEPTLRDLYLEVLKERKTPVLHDPLRWLPSTIAVPLAMSENAVTAQRRFTSVRSFLENLFKMLLLLEVACSANTANERMQIAVRSLGNRAMSLGGAMKRAGGPFNRIETFFPKTLPLMPDARGDRADSMHIFAEFRNDDAHSPPPSEATYAKHLQEIRTRLDELTSAAIVDWKTLAIVVPQDTYFNDEDIVYELAHLSGNRIVPPMSKVVTESRLSKGRVYLQTATDFIDLDPLFVFQSCPTCELEELFMLERPHASKPMWRSGRGHKIRSDVS